VKKPHAALFDEQSASSRRDHSRGLPLLWAALGLTVLFHGALLTNGSFYRTYDALIHIFFGSHYATAWFDPWEPRWYTGFTVFSYPPLAHQLIALLSSVLDLRAAFALVQLGALLLLTIGVYRFSRLLVSPVAAGYAALLTPLSSAIVETVHVFGQLPTTLSIGLLLNALPFAVRYLRSGEHTDLLRALAWIAATTAAHHITTLFGSVFFAGPVLLIAWLEGRQPVRTGALAAASKATSSTSLLKQPRSRFGWRASCNVRALSENLPRTYRLVVVIFLTVAALLVTVLPYWLWARGDPITQVPIPHGSRDSFLVNTNAGVMFFLIPWISGLWFMPYALYKSLGWRWPAGASLLLLFVLGTGGTTPIPKLILRGAFDILTLERFTFWASVLILPFAGLALESLLHGDARRWVDANFGRRVRWGALMTGALAMVVCAIFISSLTRLRKFQPEPIDVQPVVSFLEKDQHWRYRYLTLGFGDQMAWLSANTRALTPDGNYHSARRLIELTSAPVERLDGAKYSSVPGLGSLEQFLTMPEKFNLKFVFTADSFYDPLLYFSGWQRLGRLENGVLLWERDDIPPLPERLPRPPISLPLRAMWGLLPLTALLSTALSLMLRPRAARRNTLQQRGIGARLLSLLGENAPDADQPSRQALTALNHFPGSTPLHRGGWRSSLRLKHVVFSPPRFEALSGGEILVKRAFNFSRLSLAARWQRVGVLIAVGATLGFLWIQSQPQDSPERTISAYWDDLDFRRFTSAFSRVAPQQGFSLERFLLDQSVKGGLRGNYAKLQRLETRVIGERDARATVETRLHWITSLSTFTETVTQELERTGSGWRILQSPLSLPRPRERFAEDAAVLYYRAPRRLTTDTTAAGDVLDRPRLRVVGARLVSWLRPVTPPEPSPGSRIARQQLPNTERVLSVVGELENADARPADCTVTVALRGLDGSAAPSVLAKDNVGTLMIHKLLPGERTSFRVDFSGVSAPSDFGAVSSFEVSAKAVVTDLDLERPLVVWLHRDPTNAGALQGRVYNVSTADATIPRGLLSLYDANGLAWLTVITLPDHIAARDNAALQFSTALPNGYRVELLGSIGSESDPIFDVSSASQNGRPFVAPLPLSRTPNQPNAYRVQMQAFQGQP
jgi:hypothetical protein